MYTNLKDSPTSVQVESDSNIILPRTVLRTTSWYKVKRAGFVVDNTATTDYVYATRVEFPAAFTGTKFRLRAFSNDAETNYDNNQGSGYRVLRFHHILFKNQTT